MRTPCDHTGPTRHRCRAVLRAATSHRPACARPARPVAVYVRTQQAGDSVVRRHPPGRRLPAVRARPRHHGRRRADCRRDYSVGPGAPRVVMPSLAERARSTITLQLAATQRRAVGQLSCRAGTAWAAGLPPSAASSTLRSCKYTQPRILQCGRGWDGPLVRPRMQCCNDEPPAASERSKRSPFAVVIGRDSHTQPYNPSGLGGPQRPLHAGLGRGRIA